MSKLSTELQRLYALPGQTLATDDGDGCAVFDLVGADGRVRVVLFGLSGAGACRAVSALVEGAAELDLPLPAVAVDGEDGFRVWFSFAEALPLAQAVAFGDALKRRLLADWPSDQLRQWPTPEGLGVVTRVPARTAPQRWSAFIDPALAAMFADEPWLESPASDDRQADLLAGFASITPRELDHALAQLTESVGAVIPARSAALPSATLDIAPPALPDNQARLATGGGFVDPKSFLLAVMNDPHAAATHRLEAAKALLPYFERAL